MKTLEQTPAPPAFTTLIDSFQRQSSAPPWFANWRVSEAQAWSSFGLPTRRLEKWKYTSLSPLASASLRLLKSAEGDVHVDGVEQDGVRVVRLSDVFSRAVTPDEKDLIDFFRQEIATQAATTQLKAEESLTALNAALLDEVVLIDIAARSELAEPVIIHARTHGFIDGDTVPVLNTRVLIRVGAMASASIAEVFEGSSTNLFRNSVTRLEIAKGANVRHLRVQSDATSAIGVGDFRAKIERDARLETTQISLGGKIARETQAFSLVGEGADVKLDGLSVVQGRQHIDHSTTVDHVVGLTTSDQLYKHVLSGHSRAVFNGRVWIRQDAQKSNAAQLNNSLSLSRTAEIDTKPELEIDADDVKASHGATIAHLDPEHLFYLRARAISEREGRLLLAKGFALEIAMRISDESLRALAVPYIERKLTAMSLEEGAS